jgi:hypothetical protein
MRSFVGTNPATVTLEGKTVSVTFASDEASLTVTGS